MYISSTARQRARRREDEIDEENRREQANERGRLLADADRSLARLVHGMVAGASAVRLHHQLLHQKPDYFFSNSAGLAGGPGRDLLPDPLGRSPRQHRLEQWRTRHDLHGHAGIQHGLPQLRGPNSLSQPFPLDYERPKIGIGIAWPNAKDYRYEMQSVPLLDGHDGTCAQYSNQPGKVTNWWVYELKEPKRGSYVFSANVSFERGESGGFYAVLNGCKLEPPSVSR